MILDDKLLHESAAETVKRNRRAHSSRKLQQSTEFELFKMAAISLSRPALLPLMPADLQCGSVDTNRMRSVLIKQMCAVWRAYTRQISSNSGGDCPHLGTFGSNQKFNPSEELCEIANVTFVAKKDDLPAEVDFEKIAVQARVSGQIVLKTFKLLLSAIRYCF